MARWVDWQPSLLSLQVNLKRKHWDANNDAEARAHERCKQVFLQQMRKAEQAASIDEDLGPTKKRPKPVETRTGDDAVRLQVSWPMHITLVKLPD